MRRRALEEEEKRERERVIIEVVDAHAGFIKYRSQSGVGGRNIATGAVYSMRSLYFAPAECQLTPSSPTNNEA